MIGHLGAGTGRPSSRGLGAGLVLLLLLPVSMASAQEVPSDSACTGSRLRVSAFAGAGWVGVRREEVLELPVFADRGDGVFAPQPTLSLLIGNFVYDWRLSVFPGLTVGLFGCRPDSFGVSLGVSVAGFADGGNAARDPAFTLHVGTAERSIYLGFVFASTDEVRFPNGRGEILVEKGSFSPEDFILRGKRKWGWPNLALGFEILKVGT